MNEKKLSLFKLFLSTESGFIRMQNLINFFGSPDSVLKASISDLISKGINKKTAESIKSISNSGEAEKEIENAEKNNIKILSFKDPNYPKNLQNYNDKPVFLYIKGDILEKDNDSISIVGSRKPTNYGKSVTAEFAGYFSKMGITVVSGLARGIDTEAHINALKNQGRTIAVLGNGLFINYPPENASLQKKIPENGAVISEFPLNKQPDRYTFPKRNRIIAALSKATLITEAAIASGSLITARFCAEYGKDVFAVPGSIYSKYSQGTNALIKEGAFPALSPQEIIENISGFNKILKEAKQEKENSLSLNTVEKSVLDLISENDEGISIDEIIKNLSLDISYIAAIILKLEIKGLIKTMPGQIYIKVR